MTNGITSLTVKYDDCGKTKTKEVKFKGDFGFSINSDNYTVKDGNIYDKNNNKINILELPKREAYQFIGMSCTAELARDYTYSVKDIDAAECDCNVRGHYIDGKNYGQAKIASALGTGGGQLFRAECKDGKYTTEYGSYRSEGIIFKELKRHSSTVSVWLLNNE